MAALMVCVARAATPPESTAEAAPPVMEHTILKPDDMKWGPAPASFPPGAEFAILYDDPRKAEPFGLRVRMPEGYQMPPHSHPTTENVTVISGTVRVGLGEIVDRAKTQVLGVGSFIRFSPGVVHHISADTAAVV
jgi:quercetin dioxygenase-like cupin family protein